MHKNKAHVLVVDDDADTCEAMEALLEYKGFEVRSCTSGRQALEELRRRGKPCILVCDVLLPDMHGGRIVEACRNDPELRGTTVVMVTGMPSAAPAGLPLLRKPFEADALVTLIDAHCSETVGRGHCPPHTLP